MTCTSSLLMNSLPPSSVYSMLKIYAVRKYSGKYRISQTELELYQAEKEAETTLATLHHNVTALMHLIGMKDAIVRVSAKHC